MTHVTDVAEYELADGQRQVIRPFFFLWRWLAVCFSVPSYVFACICFWSKLTIKANDDLLERSVLSERASTYESASLTVRRAANTVSSAGVLTIAQAAILTTREQSPDEIPVLVVIMTWYLRHNFSSSTLWSIYDKTMSTIVMLDHVRLCNSFIPACTSSREFTMCSASMLRRHIQTEYRRGFGHAIVNRKWEGF